MKKIFAMLVSVIIAFANILSISANEYHMEFVRIGNRDFWFEYGEPQGQPGDPKNIWDTIYGIERGREIYDPATDAWYWLDACNYGAKAENKEVWFPYIYQDEKPGSTEGKWVRYTTTGAMIKGWTCVIYKNSSGKIRHKYYFYNMITGAMSKGWKRPIDLSIGDIERNSMFGQWASLVFYFDKTTGVMDVGDEDLDPLEFYQKYPFFLHCYMTVVDTTKGIDYVIRLGEYYGDSVPLGVDDDLTK